jgi:hypothetical protein
VGGGECLAYRWIIYCEKKVEGDKSTNPPRLKEKPIPFQNLITLSEILLFLSNISTVFNKYATFNMPPW